MTRREAVIETLRHRETRPIPWMLELTGQARDRLISYTGDPEIERKLDGYIKVGYFAGWPTELAEKPGYFRDCFGVEWNRNGADKDIGLPDEYVIRDLEDCDYEFPPIDEKRFRAQCRELTEGKGEDGRFCLFSFGFSMYERAWSLVGMEGLLCDMIVCPRETEALFQKIGDYFCRLVDIVLEYDVDGVYFGDDWGQQRGLIMGIDHWRHYIKPQMARLYKKVKDRGLFVFQHSCGDIHELFPDLIEMGLDCYQTFQPEIYDIEKMKELYGDKLTFWGGISTQRCLPFATREEVKAEAVRLYRALHKNGGYIIAPTHSVPQDVPPENILAMAEVFQNQDDYFKE